MYIGAYDNSRYIGLAIFSKSMFNYLYLDDLKIDIDYRRRHIGNQLIDAGLSEAKQLNLHNRSR
ncbi:MAG TPA: GNAT family N-acetyltransferase [Globicatella sulfidifaciens]|nr:GNAT family N-acetyltransferase [Globicatella sulfidifaciens]